MWYAIFTDKLYTGVVVVAGTDGDVVQLTFSALNLSQVQQNVHFYRVEDTPTEGYLTGLVEEFQTVVLPLYEAAQSNQSIYISITARNIFSGDELVVSPLDISSGSISDSEALPSFMAANIKLVRSNARVRHGRKAVGGGTELGITGQQWTSGYLALLQDLADGMAATLTAGLADVFAPVIVGRVFVPADPPAIPNAFYRLPETQVEMDDNWAYVTSGLASMFASTQRSRKIGHGS